jgi:hypothetical protein
MPSLPNVLLCAAATGLFWIGLGLALARRLAIDRGLALAIAPAIGWAVFDAAALPLFLLLGLTRTTAALVCGAAALLALAAVLMPRAATRGRMPPIPWWAYLGAALLALAPALAVLPKITGDAVMLAAPMYDHSKVAMIDDIARLGLPPGNAFFGELGATSRLAYYYLWHFGAALPVLLLGVSGWEADVALTGLTAFASLTTMMGLAVWFSGRRSAALWVVLLSLAASLRPVLHWVLGGRLFFALLPEEPDLHGWMFQASWVPQHLAAATSVLLAVFLAERLSRQPSRGLAVVLALIVVAGFESSAWIGGVTFAAAALPLGLVLLHQAEKRQRVAFVAHAAGAALLAAAVAFPVLRDEYMATAARGVGIPIALSPHAVLGTVAPESVRGALDLPAFWLLLLVVEFPAIYIGGTAAGLGLAKRRETAPEQRRLALALGGVAVIGCVIAWLFVSTIANNDLGWRAILPAVMVLTIFAAAGLARWLAAPAPRAAAFAVFLLLLGVPDGLALMADNWAGIPAPSAALFARTSELWQAVRRHTASDERVANNPLFLADMVRWPVNISWALFADRRSCFAGWDLARAYVALPEVRIDGLEALFRRVFAGDGTPEETHELATRYACRVVVVTAEDGAWRRDPFAESVDYRLVEEKPGAWRIYRAVEEARATRKNVATIREAARSVPRSDPATLDAPPLRQR